MFNKNEHIGILNMQTRKEEILDQAIAAFRHKTNLPMEKLVVDTRQLALPLDDDTLTDTIVRVDVTPRPIEFWVKVKATLDNIAMAQTAHRFVGDAGKWIVATRHVPPKLVGALRDLHIQFIDTAGNAFIETPPLYIQIEGNKRPVTDIQGTEEGMLGRAGLRLVFALLCRRDLWDATYRDIAKAARVALGTAAAVIGDLTTQGYLIEYGGQQRRLVRKKELLRKWMTAYAEKLRPKNVIGRYKATRPNLWQEENIDRFNAQWGGEVAGHRLTHYNKPELATIYMRKPVTNLVLDLKLRQDKNGDIELRERFWDFENIEPERIVVPPLLTYADLMGTGDPRNIETAKIIYDDYLQRYIEQD